MYKRDGYIKRVYPVRRSDHEHRISHGKIYHLDDDYIKGDDGKPFKPASSNVKYWLFVDKEAYLEQEGAPLENSEAINYEDRKVTEKEEKVMSYQELKIETTTLVNGVRIEDWEDKQLLKLVAAERTAIKEYEELGVECDYTKAKINLHRENQLQITALLDGMLEQ